jgi:hypothetical protein
VKCSGYSALFVEILRSRSNTHVHFVLSPAVLFKGWFYTTVMSHKTRVDFKIRNNYEVSATFSSQGTTYEFNMRKWSKTREGVANAASSFNFFAQLLCSRFGNHTEFVTTKTEELPDGQVQTTTIYHPEQIIKYAVRDVFICAEEIIKQHRRSVLDYAIFHRELGRQSTYEEYIHLVACHCLVHSNFHAPSVNFPQVDFCNVEQDYNAALLADIQSSKENPDSDGGDS